MYWLPCSKCKILFSPEAMVFAETILLWIKSDTAQESVHSGWPLLRISTFEWENNLPPKKQLLSLTWLVLTPLSWLSSWSWQNLFLWKATRKKGNQLLLSSFTVTWGTCDFYRLQSTTIGTETEGKERTLLCIFKINKSTNKHRTAMQGF